MIQYIGLFLYLFVGIVTLVIDNYFISNFLVSRYEKPLQQKLEMLSAKIVVVIFWPIWIYKRQKHS